MINNTDLDNKQAQELFQVALNTLEGAYAPYSKFKVGAAILCENGSIYTGINIENAAYSVSNCAERTALFKAVSEGHRKFKAIAVAGRDCGASDQNSQSDENIYTYAWPCGVCRQALVEFSPEMAVVVGTKESDIQVEKLSTLLPHYFELERYTD